MPKVRLNASVYTNLEEASRHRAATVAEDVPYPMQFFIRGVVQQYISDHREDFDAKPDGQYVFVGGDAQKVAATETEDPEVEGDSEDPITFSMSNGPSEEDTL